MDTIIIKGLKTKCVIGDYDWERKRPQQIVLDIKMKADLSEACKTDLLSSNMLDYNQVAKDILQFVENSSYHLVETLAQAITDLCLAKHPMITSMTVRLTKPAAIKAADAAIVEITRAAN